jgi:hypothetical protein
VSASITHRLDVALERAAWRYPESPVKAIYLTVDDWADFDAAMREDWPTAAHTFSYRDVQIRSGTRSRLVTKNGCLVCIPKHVSPRTREAA